MLEYALSRGQELPKLNFPLTQGDAVQIYEKEEAFFPADDATLQLRGFIGLPEADAPGAAGLASPDLMKDALELIDMPATLAGPVRQQAVRKADPTVLIGIRVPEFVPLLAEPAYVVLATKVPQQFDERVILGHAPQREKREML